MGIVRRSAVALFVVVLLLFAGCVDDAPDPDEEDLLGEELIESSTEEIGIADWIVGTWAVDQVLGSIEPSTMGSVAVQPAVQWSCRVGDGMLMIETDFHLYSGLLGTDGDEWHYDGFATYPGDDGTQWTSHIIIEGVRQGDDFFGAEMWDEVSSDEDGVLYSATWTQIGTRIP